MYCYFSPNFEELKDILKDLQLEANKFAYKSKFMRNQYTIASREIKMFI